VLRAEGLTVGWVVLDTASAPDTTVTTRIRAAAHAAGIGEVIISTTRTDSAVDWTNASETLPVETGAIEALQRAASRLTEARLGIGEAVMPGRRDGDSLSAPLPAKATVLKIDNVRGIPIATLAHLPYDTMDCAADTARLVKEATGAECVCGASGIAASRYSTRSMNESCANGILTALKSIKPRPLGAPALAYYERSVQIGSRITYSEPEQQAVLRSVHGAGLAPFVPTRTSAFSATLATLTLGGVEFAFVPDTALAHCPVELRIGDTTPATLLCRGGLIV
jgi:hypothetical protein